MSEGEHMSTKWTDDEMEKLPKWARERVCAMQLENGNLTAQLEDERLIASANNPPTRVLVAYRQNLGFRGLYLDERETVEFQLDHRNRSWVRVAMRGSALHIEADASVSVHPRACNSFTVSLEE